MILNDRSSHVKSFSQIHDFNSCQCLMTCHLVTALVTHNFFWESKYI